VQLLDYAVRPHLAQEELDSREAFPEGAQNGWEGFVRGGGNETQSQPSDLTVADALNRTDGLIQLHENAPRFLQQQRAGLGHPYTSVGPLEEPDPQIPFQLLDLVAQRRLRDVEPLRRTVEARLLRYRYEVA